MSSFAWPQLNTRNPKPIATPKPATIGTAIIPGDDTNLVSKSAAAPAVGSIALSNASFSSCRSPAEGKKKENYINNLIYKNLRILT